MKRREFIKDIIAATLAIAAVSSSGLVAAGAVGSQVRHGVNRKLREEDQQAGQEVGDKAKVEKESKASEAVGKESEAEKEVEKEGY